MLRSKIVLQLAELASQGKYTVSPKEATYINDLFVRVADLINELEAAEARQEEELVKQAQAQQALTEEEEVNG